MALRHRLSMIATAAFLAGLAASAQAQHSNVAATGSGWQVECTSNRKALDCRAFAEVVQRDNKKVIISLTVRYPAETKKPVMMIQVPLGILVSEAIAVSVDNNQPQNTPVQTCTQAGCFAGSAMPASLIAAMRNGKELKIVFENVNKQPVTVTMPLAGFALAYDKIASK